MTLCDVTRRAVPANAPLATSIEALLDHYEDVGDFVIRFLAQEERAPVMARTNGRDRGSLGRRKMSEMYLRRAVLGCCLELW